MRLLLITNTFPPGDISGVGALVAELAGEAGRRGHEVRVLRRAGGTGGDATLLRVPGPKILFPLTAAAVFLWRFRARPPEVIHVHESDGAPTALLVRVCRLLGHRAGAARVVATLQVSYREERLSVRSLRVDGVVVSRPTLGERIFAWGRAPLLAVMGRITAKAADAVVAPSQATARELERDYRCTVDAVIPNGVLAVSEPGLRGRGKGVLYVGRLRTRKAVAVLLEGLALLVERIPDVTLDIVGSGEQERELERQCSALGLSDRVRFRGALAREEVAQHYEKAAVLCLPSLYEGFPVTILEAMAAALPVVATRVAGVPEAVRDGVTGILVDPEDAEGLASALGRLLGDEDLQDEMGAAARRVFEEEYSIGVVADAHFSLYRSLCESHSPRSTQ